MKRNRTAHNLAGIVKSFAAETDDTPQGMAVFLSKLVEWGDDQRRSEAELYELIKLSFKYVGKNKLNCIDRMHNLVVPFSHRLTRRELVMDVATDIGTSILGFSQGGYNWGESILDKFVFDAFAALIDKLLLPQRDPEDTLRTHKLIQHQMVTYCEQLSCLQKVDPKLLAIIKRYTDPMDMGIVARPQLRQETPAPSMQNRAGYH